MVRSAPTVGARFGEANTFLTTLRRRQALCPGGEQLLIR
jgi:hypothetical protein